MALSKNERMLREIDDLREDLKTYQPGKEAKGVYSQREVPFPEQLCIGLFGRTGIGKTSLINSLKFAVAGYFRVGKWLPVATLEKAGGHTLHRSIAPLTNHISVIDNRGFLDFTRDGTLHELQAQIDGKRGYTKEVKWENTGRTADGDYINCVNNRKDSIGCAVFVFSARDNISESTNGLHKTVTFLHAQQGRYPVAVITHVDVVDEQRVMALLSALKVTGISEIFKVANITEKKIDLEIDFQHTLLSLLDRCMTDGDANAVFKHHQQKEHNEEQRKKQEQERKKVEQEKEAERIRKQKLLEAKNKKIAVAVGVGAVGSTTGAGALIGMALGGPVGSAVGAGIGAIGGSASLLTGMALADR